jgi:hypothetical protein
MSPLVESRPKSSVIIARIIILALPVVAAIAFVVASIYLLSKIEFEKTAISPRIASVDASILLYRYKRLHLYVPI